MRVFVIFFAKVQFLQRKKRKFALYLRGFHGKKS